MHYPVIPPERPRNKGRSIAPIEGEVMLPEPPPERTTAQKRMVLVWVGIAIVVCALCYLFVLRLFSDSNDIIRASSVMVKEGVDRSKHETSAGDVVPVSSPRPKFKMKPVVVMATPPTMVSAMKPLVGMQVRKPVLKPASKPKDLVLKSDSIKSGLDTLILLVTSEASHKIMIPRDKDLGFKVTDTTEHLLITTLQGSFDCVGKVCKTGKPNSKKFPGWVTFATKTGTDTLWYWYIPRVIP